MNNIITDINLLRRNNKEASLEEGKDIIYKLECILSNLGVGLAAPQIGINKKVAIIRYDKERLDLINPKILDRRNIYIHKEEGCLSFPNKYVNTYRHKEIFLIDDLHPNGIVTVGFISTIIEHECDHLDGILMIDREISNKINRNDLCPCGSKIKFKKCHGKDY